MPEREAVGSYVVPDWSVAPAASFGLEVIKGGTVVETVPLDRECTLFGRNAQVVDVHVQHASTSREHAVIQFGKDNAMFIADHLGSTHGTFVNKQRLKAKELVKLQVGDMIRFGESTRLFHVIGPAGMEPAEEQVQQTLEEIRLEKLQRKNGEKRKEMEKEKDTGMMWGMSMTDADDEEDDDDNSNIKGNDDDVPEYVRQAREKEANHGAGRFASSLDVNTLSAAEANAKDAPLLEKLEKQRAKALNIQMEVERIQAKEINQGDGLTEGQVRQVEKNTAQLDQLQAQILVVEHTLRERAERRKGGQPVGAEKVVKGKRRRDRKAIDLVNGDDVDDATSISTTSTATGQHMVKNADGAFVFTRTAVSSLVGDGGGGKRARKSRAKVETVETLQAKIGKLEAEEIELKTQEACALQKQTEMQTKVDAADPLDRYMLESDANLAKQDAERLQAKLKQLENELKAAKALYDLIKPALSTTLSPPVEKTETETIEITPKHHVSHVNQHSIPAATDDTIADSDMRKDDDGFAVPMLPPGGVTLDINSRNGSLSGNDIPETTGSMGSAGNGSIESTKKKGRVNRKRPVVASNKGNEEDNGDDDGWVAPTDQTGDGITVLNARLGY